MLASLSVNILRATIVAVVGLVVVLAGLDSILSEILIGLVFAAMIWSDRDHPLSNHFALMIVIGSLIFPWLRREIDLSLPWYVQLGAVLAGVYIMYLGLSKRRE